MALTALAVLVLSLLAPSLASALAHGATPDPKPQAAPTAPAGSTPAPDPVPQAATSTHPVVTSASSHPSPVLTPSERAPTVIVPRIVHVAPPSAAAPPAPASAAAQRPTASSDVTPVSPVRPNKPQRRAAVPHPSAHHARPVVATHVSLSFPLGFLEKDLLRIAPGAFQGGDARQRDGLLLLLASLAMGVLAVSSFALSRRLKGLE